ncbi:Vacuolar protein sorting/targeting protein 10 [Thelohanellus kitauei]|uniref:Vacuolar protein sorting/targeting protein 10 n=1 Tax=Thelohanellus kitauei TaxID=669202 RepID=A0A0C2IVA0_THEKT|nr:Vacuolar protein sorting/targeting protein 10 [Thelohanellus kitauei]
MFGAEKLSGRISFSYDQGIHWYNTNLEDTNFIVINQLESQNNLGIAAINYNERNQIYSLFLFNFSRVICINVLMIDRTCYNEDFEVWYVPRYHENCYQGLAVWYMRKKPSVICVEYRTFHRPKIESCPCSLEDFLWYHEFNHSEPN